MSKFHETVTTQKPDLKTIGKGRFGAKLATYENGVRAVIKPERFGNDLFRGIPSDELCRREVLAYHFDRDVLKFNIVPETLIGKFGKSSRASIQEFKQGYVPKDIVPKVFNREQEDWKQRVAKLASMMPAEDTQKMILMDLVIGSKDRHAANALINVDAKKLYAIDNGVAFGKSFKFYRNVFHKYLHFKSFTPTKEMLKAVEAVTLPVCKEVLIWLTDAEQEAVYARAQFVLEKSDKLDFWTLSKGNLGQNDFPSQSRWIRSFLHRDLAPPELMIPLAQ